MAFYSGQTNRLKCGPRLFAPGMSPLLAQSGHRTHADECPLLGVCGRAESGPRYGGKAMERREFIKIVCGLVGTWPIAAYAQQVGELRRIGVLGADATVWSSWTVAFVTRLRELGWTTGETIDVDYRWAGGSSKRVSDHG